MGVAASESTPRRRVRHQARDALAVAVFSVGASAGFAVLITVVLALVS